MTAVGPMFLADVLTATVEDFGDERIAEDVAGEILAELERRGYRIVPTDTADDAWHSVWLHGKWRWLTQNMTTEERTCAAEAIERAWARHESDDGTTMHETTRAELWWWRE